MIKRALVFFVLVFFVIIFFEFEDLEDSAGFGEIEAVGGGVEGADDAGGVGFGLEACRITGGELEAVEQGGGALSVEVAGGEGVDDDGESDLDGFAVFEGRELDVLAWDEIEAGGFRMAEAAVALVKAVMEVAPLIIGEGWCFALGSVGLDVSAELVLHGFSYGYPQGYGLKVEWLQ
jgi:hypothetical protein